MSNILLVEPGYRSKFPPLGLLRISTFHKGRGDAVTFVRGKDPKARALNWHRIYVSSLFTWELPRTVETIRFYSQCVSDPRDIVVGGIGATLLPSYLEDNVNCRLVRGPLSEPGMIDPDMPPLAEEVPDYDLLRAVDWTYRPEDSYFARVSMGCSRNCKFCAVPLLEPTFGRCRTIGEQISEVDRRFGERQHLVLLDNNVLALRDGFGEVVAELRALGFERGARRNRKLRTVDFNQGIDCRYITQKVAKALGSICLDPVRLAFDHPGQEKPYRRAIQLLSEAGFVEFTNYQMFNYDDGPEFFYRRLQINAELNAAHGVRITSFPMRYVPVDDVTRRYVSPQWHWRYLRGIQCVLQATHGMVSPNPPFVARAFGHDYAEFLDLMSMPDRYVIHRDQFEKSPQVKDWRRCFHALSQETRIEFLDLLERIHKSKNRAAEISSAPRRFARLLEHYYPGGQVPHD